MTSLACPFKERSLKWPFLQLIHGLCACYYYRREAVAHHSYIFSNAPRILLNRPKPLAFSGDSRYFNHHSDAPYALSLPTTEGITFRLYLPRLANHVDITGITNFAVPYAVSIKTAIQGGRPVQACDDTAVSAWHFSSIMPFSKAINQGRNRTLEV